MRLRLRGHNCCGAKMTGLSSSLYVAGLFESRGSRRRHIIKEASVITKRRCPHTGVVNFYEKPSLCWQLAP